MRRWLGRIGLLLLVAAAPVGVYLLPAEGPSYPKDWDARVVDLVHFVEQERGLRFTHPVTVRFLADEDFKDKVRSPAPSADDRKQLEEALAEMRALRLVTGHPDLFKAGNDLVTSDVVGLYVPADKALYVRGTDLTPYVRTTLVHELTHAAQDQHFDIAAMQGDAEDDSIARTLIEGDAVRVQEAYERQLTSAEQQSYAKTEAGFRDSADGSGEDVPEVLKDIFTYPYVFGPTLLDVLEADGGNSAVDKAFRHPPVTDAQVVDPRAYPLTFSPQHLPPPSLPKGAKAVDDAHPFGQVGLVEVLGSALGYAPSWAAVQGWAGDTARSYKAGGTSCVALDVAMSDQAKARRLEGAFGVWQRAVTTATVSREGSTVAVRACDPGASEAALRGPEPRAFDVLAQRAQVIHVFMRSSGFGFAKARCVTDTLISTYGSSGFVALNEGAPTPTGQRKLVNVVRTAYARC